jgi:uncharacterized ion transporter superfamily protein YfcC
MKIKALDSFVLLGIILMITLGLTWIIPAGEYVRQLHEGKNILVPGSFSYVDSQHAVSPLRLFTAPIRGLIDASEVIAFVLLIGVAFGIITKTGALDASLHALVQWALVKDSRTTLLPILLMIFFSIAGNTFGMAEEVLVFLLITIPLAQRLGYDPIVGVAIPFVGAAVGFTGAAFNPFTVGIAQGLSDLPPFSGSGYRMLVWFIFTGVAIYYVSSYAKKIKNNPGLKTVDFIEVKDKDLNHEVPFTAARKWIMVIFVFSLGLLIYGVKVWDWYIEEIAGLFLALGIAAAVIGRLKSSDTTQAFVAGSSDMLGAALVIALSRAVLVIAEEGKIIDTILYSVAQLTEGLPNYLAVQAMFLIQGGINFFIPSGSGQAALTMPVMAPLSDLLGVHRQSAVLAYQLGDGLFNLIIPTSGVTMGILNIAGIPFNVWLKWCGKLVLVLSLLSMVLLAIAEWASVW